jgi:hypothetical protein
MAKLTISALLLAAALILPVHAEESSALAVLGKPYDCVIEPFVETELGSPATGILEQLVVDRGDRVTKGMVVARLRSDLEQASLDLAKARAESVVLIELARERVSLLKKEVARVTELHGKQIALQPNSISRSANCNRQSCSFARPKRSGGSPSSK